MTDIQPGYKQTEVGVIPKDWYSASLGSLTVLMTNGFVGTATRHYAENENGILYIQGYNVEENSFNFHGIKYVTPEFHKAHAKSCLRTGDLLTVQTGDVGLTTVVTDDLAGSNCHALIISRYDKRNISSGFISFYLNSSPGRSRLKLIETGTTMKHLNVGDMLEFLVPLPPTKAEQEAIAEALSDTDALIESLEQLITKKRHLKQGTMQQLLTGKKRLPGFQVKSGYKQTEVGLVPVDWNNELIGSFFEISAGRDLVEEHYSIVNDDKYCYPVYSNALTNKGLYGYSKVHQYEGDRITVTARGDVGSAVYRNARFNAIGRLLVLAPKSECDLRYLSEFINNFVEFAFESTGVPQLTAPQISKYQVVLPPTKAEQTAIATVLSDMDTEIAALETQLAKTRALKQGMMHSLLTGRIRLV